MPVSPSTVSAAMWPSPRNSRSSVCACQRTRCGSSGHGERGVAGEQRAALRVARRRRARRVRASDCRRRARRAEHLVAEGPPQRRVGGGEPCGEHGVAASCSSTRRVHRLPDERRVEVVEGCDDDLGGHGAHRRRAGREVRRAVVGDARRGVVLGCVRREVDHPVDGLEAAPRTAGEVRGSRRSSWAHRRDPSRPTPQPDVGDSGDGRDGHDGRGARRVPRRRPRRHPRRSSGRVKGRSRCRSGTSTRTERCDGDCRATR